MRHDNVYRDNLAINLIALNWHLFFWLIHSKCTHTQFISLWLAFNFKRIFRNLLSKVLKSIEGSKWPKLNWIAKEERSVGRYRILGDIISLGDMIWFNASSYQMISCWLTSYQIILLVDFWQFWQGCDQWKDINGTLNVVQSWVDDNGQGLIIARSGEERIEFNLSWTFSFHYHFLSFISFDTYNNVNGSEFQRLRPLTFDF